MAKINALTARTAAATKPRTVKTDAAKAAAPRKPASVSLALSIDGAAPISLGNVALSLWADSSAFTEEVVACVVADALGLDNVSVKACGGARGSYGATFKAGRKTIKAFWGAPSSVAAYVEARAIDEAPAAAPVAAPAVVEAPKPAAPAAVSQPVKAPAPADAKPVAQLANQAPVTHNGVTVALPPVAVVEAAKAVDAAAPMIIALTVDVSGHGTFTIDRSEGLTLGRFVGLTVCPRVAEVMSWARASVETATDMYAGGFRARIAGDKGASVVVVGKPASADAKPVAIGVPLPAIVTRAGVKIDALAASAGIMPKAPSGALAKALAQRDALNATAQRAAATPRVEAAPRRTARVQEMYDLAATGALPEAPDFSAPTHARYVKPLAEVVAKVKAGDVAWLRNHPVEPKSSSRIALRRFIDLCILAFDARAAKAVTKA